MYGVGNGAKGRLGDVANEIISQPKEVKIEGTVESISCGTDFSIALVK